MTLCIRVVTSLGMVIVADSLVTISRQVEIITDSDKKYYLDTNQAETIFPGWPSNRSPPILVDRSFINSESKIASTSPNVKKLFDFPELNVAFSFAGTADFEYCYIRNGGIRKQPIPPELAVKTIVKEALDLTFEETVFATDVGEFICLALTSSLISRIRKRATPTSFNLMGGGYSKHNPFPDTFDFSLDIRKGTGRFDVLNGVSNCLSTYLKHMVPMYCTSRNWFEEFLKVELDNLVRYCLTDAIWWSFVRPFSGSVINNQIIPDVMEHVIFTLRMVDEILSADQEVNLYDKKEVNLSDIIKIAYEVDRESSDEWSYQSSVIDSFRRHESYVSDMIHYYESTSWNEFKSRAREAESAIEEDIQNRSYSTEFSKSETYRGRLPSEQKAILSENCFNTLYFIFTEMIPRSSLAVRFVRSGYVWEAGGDRSVGISHIGKGEVLQRIIYGLDDTTRRKMSSEIRDFQMHATKRFTQLLTARLKSVDAPEPTKFDFYQSEKRDSATSYTEPSSLSESTTNETIETKLFDFDDNLIERTKIGIDGNWKGKFSLTNSAEEVKDESNVFNCKVELHQLNESMPDSESKWAGSGTVDGSIIEINNLNWDGNIIEFAMRIKEHEIISSDEEFNVEGKMTEWGLDCVFITSHGTREYLLLTKETEEIVKENSKLNDGIDSETINSVLSELYSELEEFEPPRESFWDIDYIHMPMENAIDLARYLMESTIKKQQFNSEVPSVGGPIVMLKMTKDGGIEHL